MGDHSKADTEGGKKSLEVGLDGSSNVLEVAFAQFEYHPYGGYITFDVLAPPPFNATFQLRGAEWEIGPVSAFSPGGLPVIFNNVRVRAFLNVISQESPDRFSHLVSFVPQGGVDPLDNEATNPALAGPLAGAPGVLEARVELRPGNHYSIRVVLEAWAEAAPPASSYSLQGKLRYDSLFVFR